MLFALAALARSDAQHHPVDVFTQYQGELADACEVGQYGRSGIRPDCRPSLPGLVSQQRNGRRA